MILIFSSFLLWWIMMSYAFLSLTPVWCEINVFLFFLFVFFYCFFVLLCYLLFIFLVIQSDLEKSRMNLLVLSSLVNGSIVSN